MVFKKESLILVLLLKFALCWRKDIPDEFYKDVCKAEKYSHIEFFIEQEVASGRTSFHFLNHHFNTSFKSVTIQ